MRLNGFLGPMFIGVGGLLCLCANWPGHLSFDSVVQLSEGRFGVYSGAHPPVMSWLLGIFDAIRPGATIFIVFQTVMIACALIGLIMLGRRIGLAVTALAAAFAITPQLLIYPAIVWKDVLFAASATAGFALLAHASVVWLRPARRFGLLVLAAVFLILAALTRQNGAVVLPFAAGAVGWIAARFHRTAPVSRGLIVGLTFLALTALTVTSAAEALASHTDPGPMPNRPWRSLQTYDLVNALALSPHAALPVLHSEDSSLEHDLRTEGVALYSPIRADTLQPIFEHMEGRPQSTALIDGQWRDLIISHPLLYLAARARTFGWVFLTPDHDQCVLIYTGVDGPAEEMSDAGLAERKTDWDDNLADYAMLFASTPVYSHAAFGVLGLAILILLIRRRRPADIAAAGMIAAAIAFAASFAVISIACDYRYLYDLDIAAIAGTLYAAATWNGVAGDPGETSLRFPPFLRWRRSRSYPNPAQAPPAP